MLHRVRIYNPTPVPVKSLAGYAGRLALGRENGSIEIWSTKNSLCCINQFESPSKCVDALAYAKSPHDSTQLTLYSTGIDGRIIRYEGSGEVGESFMISGSPVWCLESSPSYTKLAAGTEDGFIHIINTEEDSLVAFKRLQQKLIGRVLSCAWFPCENRLVTGSQDSIKIWDLGKERAIDTVQLSRVFRKDQALVFAVVVIEGGKTMVTGDSFGRVIFWDTNTGSQIQSYRLHAADVLSLHAIGDEVFASGVDPIILKFFKAEGRWLHQKITQMHTHDIRAIWSEGDTLFTAGVDSQLGIVHLKTDNLHFQRLLPPSYSRNMRTLDNLILLNYGNHVELWTTQHDKRIKHLIKVKAPATRTIKYISLCRSSFATASENKINIYKFSLSKVNVPDGCDKIFQTTVTDSPIQCIALSPSGRRLFVAHRNGKLQLINVTEETMEIKASMPGVIITASAVGQHLVAFADIEGNVSVFDHELRLRCSAPKMSGIPISLRIDCDKLYVAYDDLVFYELDTKTEKFASWSKDCLQNPAFEERLAAVRRGMLSADGVRDIVVTPTDDIVLGFEAKLYMVRKALMSGDFKQGMVMSPDFMNAVKLWRHYDELAVCEISGAQLVSKLPPLLKKKRFN